MWNQDRPGQPPKRPRPKAEDGEPLSGAEDEESRLAGATSQEAVAFLDFTVLDLIFPFIISIQFSNLARFSILSNSQLSF